MNKKIASFGALVLAVGCHASADATSECAKELNALAVMESASIDVEEIVDDLVFKSGVETYWDSIGPIETSCLPPERLPDLMPEPVGAKSSQTPAAKPVQKISIPGRTGVVFV